MGPFSVSLETRKRVSAVHLIFFCLETGKQNDVQWILLSFALKFENKNVSGVHLIFFA